MSSIEGSPNRTIVMHISRPNPPTPPSWIPMKICMQKYCEPFFSAIERWRKVENEKLLLNRIALVDAVDQLFHEYSQFEKSFSFDISCENDNVALLDEVLPSAGKFYIYSGDEMAFQNAKKLVPKELFNRIGLFFQQNLLRNMAGRSEAYLSTANVETRKSLLACVEKLLRLPDSAGFAHFVFSDTSSKLPTNHKLLPVPNKPMSPTAEAFFKYILASRPSSVVEGKNRAPVSPVPEKAAQNLAASKKRFIVAETAPQKAPRLVHVPKVTGLVGKLVSRSSVNNAVSVALPVIKDQEIEDILSDDSDSNNDSNNEDSHSGIIGKKIVSSGRKVENKRKLRARLAQPAAAKQKKAEPRPTPKKKRRQQNIEKGKVSTKPKIIGTKVASYLLVPMNPAFLSQKSQSNPTLGNLPKMQQKLFMGEVVDYIPPTTRTGKDHKYVVHWYDHDESEVLDEKSFRDAIDLYELHFLWTVNHKSVDTKVAAYFFIPGILTTKDDQVDGAEKLFIGRVSKFCPPSTPQGTDQLYHISWEDGDEQDMDEQEYQKAKKLYQTLHSAKETTTESKRKRGREDDGAADEEQEPADSSSHHWTTNHLSVHTKVARRTSTSKPGRKRAALVQNGIVTKYNPLISSYWVLWENGKEEVLSEAAYQEGVEVSNDLLLIEMKASGKWILRKIEDDPRMCRSDLTINPSSPNSLVDDEPDNNSEGSKSFKSLEVCRSSAEAFEPELEPLSIEEQERKFADRVWTADWKAFPYERREIAKWVTRGHSSSDGKSWKNCTDCMSGLVIKYSLETSKDDQNALFYVEWSDSSHDIYDLLQYTTGIKLWKITSERSKRSVVIIHDDLSETEADMCLSNPSASGNPTEPAADPAAAVVAENPLEERMDDWSPGPDENRCWTVDHVSVCRPVFKLQAALPSTSGLPVSITGDIVRYFPPTTDDLEDQLYEIEWIDDSQRIEWWTEDQLQESERIRLLYSQHGILRKFARTRESVQARASHLRQSGYQSVESSQVVLAASEAVETSEPVLSHFDEKVEWLVNISEGKME